MRNCIISALLVVLSVMSLRAQNDHPRVRHEMLVSTQWLSDHLHDLDLIILCVSPTAEFCSKGHIPGARYVALGDIAVTRNGIPNELPTVEQLQKVFESAGVSNNSRIVLYGSRYGLMAARAYFTLDYLGVADRACLLDGGLEKWTAEHRGLSTDTPAVTPGKLYPSPHPDILVETSAMRDLVANKSSKVAIIDARPPDEFSGVKLSEDVPKAGHIPHAKGMYWMNNLVSAENPVLRPEAELRRLYENMEPSAGTGVVTYCRTGMQSSFSYFVAKYLGYDTKMYDASFYEWSRMELPVEK
jgi:thiosulfate/3-mercaptopyruvate sulfurtransferase